MRPRAELDPPITRLDESTRVEASPRTHVTRDAPAAMADAGEVFDVRAAPVPRAVVGTGVEVIDTRYAGAFYLLNVALALELYGDFTRPMHRGLDLSIWDFVGLVGRGLLADAGVDGDPVWPLLARLAGHEPDDAPAAGFDPPDGWRLPRAWLDAFPGRTRWRWTVTGDRLRVWHPARFPVLDVARTPDPPAMQVALELEPYGAEALAWLGHRPQPIARGDPVARWLAGLVPYVRARLARALGSSRSAVGALVGRAPGRVRATLTHVDVRLALADLPIEVRLAGLDRDPGWIPAAGRTVSFRFE
jgi:hypothetical protein